MEVRQSTWLPEGFSALKRLDKRDERATEISFTKEPGKGRGKELCLTLVCDHRLAAVRRTASTKFRLSRPRLVLGLSVLLPKALFKPHLKYPVLHLYAFSKIPVRGDIWTWRCLKSPKEDKKRMNLNVLGSADLKSDSLEVVRLLCPLFERYGFTQAYWVMCTF